MFQLPKRRMLKGEMRDAEKPGLQSVPAPSAAAEARGRGGEGPHSMAELRQ